MSFGGYQSIENGYQGDLAVALDDANRAPLDASVDGQGGSIRNKPVFTIDQVAFQLNRGDGLITFQGQTYESGAEWFGGQGPAKNDWYNLAVSKGDADGTLNTLSFGFYESLITLPEPYVFRNTAGNLQLGLGIAQGFSPLSLAQREATRQAIATWDELIDISFVETPFARGDLNFMNTTTGPAQAAAYLPYDYGVSTTKNFEGKGVSFAEISGDVYINPNQASNLQFDEGQYGLTTLIHEIGHALGLEHPGAYNFGPGFDVIYENGAEYYQDSNQYSIMSYWDARETGGQHVDWTNLTYRYASTPGIHDIAAIQRIYGADKTTRSGDDIYGFNATAGGANADSFNFVKTPAPVVTIWDVGGHDTLDLSGYSTPSVIDLNPGAYSSAGGTVDFLTLEQINANRALEGLAPRTQATLDLYNQLFKDPDNLTTGLMKDNIGIAYGVTIEDAVGGSGADKISGNAAANKLSGNGGNDQLFGRAGEDQLFGGAGNDRLSGGDGVDRMWGGAGDDIFVAEVNTTGPKTKGGLSVDVIFDFDQFGDDKIDFTGATFLRSQTVGSTHAAESVLGIELDGLSKNAGSKDQTTLVFGDINGDGQADFVIALLGTRDFDSSDIFRG